MVLVACAGTGDSDGIAPEAGETVPPVSEEAVPLDSVDEEAVGPPKGSALDPPEILDLLLVTGSGGEVTVINPDGTGARELRGAAGPGEPSSQPTWAPASVDGRRRVAWTELGGGGTFRIALGDVKDGEVMRYPSPVAPFYYYWSPDATLLAFLGQNVSSPVQMGVLDYQRDEVEIVGGGQPFYFDWRPDSRAIVTHVDDVLSVFTRTGEAWSSESIPLRPGLFQAPAWLSEDRILTVVPISPGSVQVSLRRAQNAQDDPSPQRLISSDLEGRSIVTLADLEGAASFESDPTGRWVAFSNLSGPLRVVDLTDGGEVAVSEGKVAAFEWSPVGGKLLFMEVDSEAPALVPKVWDGDETLVFPSFYPTRALLLQYLPFWDQYTRSLTWWSPTGEAFTYPGVSSSNGEDRIFVQYLDDSQPVAVRGGVFASWSPVPRDHLTAS